MERKSTNENGAGHSREEETAPISGKETNQLYHEIAGQARMLPVSPTSLADEAHIPVLDFCKESAGRHLGPEALAILDGLFVRVPGQSCILFNGTRPRKRIRFTLAHEIAHMLRGITGRSPKGNGLFRSEAEAKPEERLCDRIAAEILMPADLLSMEIIRAEGKVNTYALAEHFDVSLTAMRVRLGTLGLL